MKLTILGIIVIAVTTFALQTSSAQTPSETIKVRGCLLGNGSTENPWSLKSAVLPAPPAPAPAGGRGDGGGRGAGGGRGRGDAAGRGAAPADDGRGAAAAPAPPPAPPAQPPVDLRLSGIDMSPWRNMFVEVEGTLGPRPASGLREFQVTFAHSAYGDCR
jgi:hypothetical protein